MNKQLKENEICHVTVKLDHNTEGEFMNLNYRKKPVVIQAWQLTIENFINGTPKLFKHSDVQTGCMKEGGIIIEVWGSIKTLEGEMTVSENDWIIRGVNGEFYPCKPDIFEKTYEVAE